MRSAELELHAAGEERTAAPSREPQVLVEQGIGRLLDELRQGKSERLEQYLVFVARFHRYSLQNQMLILMQCPRATYVAGYKTWQAMGYQVRRGEQGIRVLAPRPYTRRDALTGEETERIAFKAVSVFDASQLANLGEQPLPAFFTPLADDQGALYARLLAVVQADGIAVREEFTRLAQGYSAKGRIAIREGLDSRNRVLTLLHEYTHELLHWDEQGKEQTQPVQECQAEAVAYVVAQHFGIHSPFSADYLLRWGTTPQELMAELEVVRRTAGQIIERVECPAREPAPQAEPAADALPFKGRLSEADAV